MVIDKLYGPSLPELNWVPAPSFLMRRNRVLKQLERQPPGKLLEVGCGSGTLLYELSQKRFVCHGLETSDLAFKIASEVNEAHSVIFSSANSAWENRFDYVMALEVLEHVEDDLAALHRWVSWLKPGGKLLLSVPAHHSKWTDSDVWAGHYRRYEKETLMSQLSAAGLIIEEFECWGFPLSNLLLSWRSRINKADMQRHKSGNDRKQSSDNSGVDRSAAAKLFPLLSSLPGRLAMRTAFGLQSLTVGRDWGVGYLATASKPKHRG